MDGINGITGGYSLATKCFAGDVGSIGIALILTFFVGRLMMVTGDAAWIMLIMIYGVDGLLTTVSLLSTEGVTVIRFCALLQEKNTE